MDKATEDKKLRILMIEDCKGDVLLFEHMLGNFKSLCHITDVPRMIDAFKKIDSNEFDLIMLDLNLIDLDGVGNITAIKAERPGIPVIVYSGRDDARLREQARTCGASAYLVKGEAGPEAVQQAVVTALAS